MLSHLTWRLVRRVLILSLAAVTAVYGFHPGIASALPPGPCTLFNEGQEIFVPGEGWWKCGCVIVDDPEPGGDDNICAWIPSKRPDPVPQTGRLQVPFVGFGYNVAGRSGLFATGRTESAVFSVNENSWSDVVNQPPGELALRTRLMKWNNGWQQCGVAPSNGGYIYNTATTSAIGWAPTWTQRPCGSGYYENWTDTFAWEGGAWRGGTVYSDYFNWLLPTLRVASAGATKPPSEKAARPPAEPPPPPNSSRGVAVAAPAGNGFWQLPSGDKPPSIG